MRVLNLVAKGDIGLLQPGAVAPGRARECHGIPLPVSGLGPSDRKTWVDQDTL